MKKNDDSYTMIDINFNNINYYCDKLYEKINKEFYDYDLVIFIAKGAYSIGKYLAEKRGVPLLEIFSSRSGNGIKKIIAPFLKFVPNFILKKFRNMEINTSVHEKKSDRTIKFDKEVWEKYKNKTKILLIDDSVDTGYSMKKSKETILEFFKDSTIKVGALNCFNKSKTNINTDFYIFEDYIIKGPWSSDSKENKKYIKEYYEWHNKYLGNE